MHNYEFLGTGGGVVELGTLRNISTKTYEKDVRQENVSDFFLLDTLKLHFERKI